MNKILVCVTMVVCSSKIIDLFYSGLDLGVVHQFLSNLV